MGRVLPKSLGSRPSLLQRPDFFFAIFEPAHGVHVVHWEMQSFASRYPFLETLLLQW